MLKKQYRNEKASPKQNALEVPNVPALRRPKFAKGNEKLYFKKHLNNKTFKI